MEGIHGGTRSQKVVKHYETQDYPVQRTYTSYCKHGYLCQIKKNLSKIAITKVRIYNKVEKHSERVRGTKIDVNVILL